MNAEDLKKTLDSHKLWLDINGLLGALGQYPWLFS